MRAGATWKMQAENDGAIQSAVRQLIRAIGKRLHLIFTCSAGLTSQTMINQPPDRKRETVVIVHGLGGNRLVMSLLQQRLRAKGYRTVNFRYWSFTGAIATHADRLAQLVVALDEGRQVEKIHFVAHSLGSILTRIVLQQSPPRKLGRVVMLTPPNRGSPVATLMRPLVGWLMPVVTQLSDRDDSFVNTLPAGLPDVEVGVLTASTDILVPLKNTHLEGQCDHRMIHCRHLTIVFRQETADLIDHFLREGSFGPRDPAGDRRARHVP